MASNSNRLEHDSKLETLGRLDRSWVIKVSKGSIALEVPNVEERNPFFYRL